jgi:MoaA/NifB/PqqE/SkfB family radical SAM enzyme
MLKRLLGLVSNKIYSLPIVVLMPHSSCNCRCVMCDIWKANHDKKEISAEMLEQHVAIFKKLGVREVVLSGGEALMHSNLWTFCSLLKMNGISVTLLSTGLLLKRHASDIIKHMDQVIVSLDGSEQVHDKIRNIPQAFQKLSEGVGQLKLINSNFKVTGRCVLQRLNYFDFINIVRTARKIGLDQISFLAADVSTPAFNHLPNSTSTRMHDVVLTSEETIQLGEIIQNSFTELLPEYKAGFIAEDKNKMRKIVQYYSALNKMDTFPTVVCNAPWVSAVIESDGSVMPCFFHKPYGNINDRAFPQIINSKGAREFRRNLNITKDEVCRKCVCSLSLPLFSSR